MSRDFYFLCIVLNFFYLIMHYENKQYKYKGRKKNLLKSDKVHSK
jgi:hypothetical protein